MPSMSIKSSGIEVDYQVARCSRCILSNKFPNITFDAQNICNYCRSETGHGVPDSAIAASQARLQTILHKTPEREYDCLVLYSGGKDSSYSLYHICNELKLRPLAFTIDNGFVAEAASTNMKAVLTALEVDHIIVRPSNKIMNLLYKKTILKKEKNPENVMYATSSCGSCISMVLSLGAKECMRRNIPIMMGGWSPGQLTETPLLPGKFLENICNKHLSRISLSNPEIRESIDRYYKEKTNFPDLYNPLYTFRYDENHILSTLASLGWKKPINTDSCSSNCTLNGYLVVDHIKKYGFHPYEYELAFHVRNNLCSRDAALNKITHLSINKKSIENVAEQLKIDHSIF